MKKSDFIKHMEVLKKFVQSDSTAKIDTKQSIPSILKTFYEMFSDIPAVMGSEYLFLQPNHLITEKKYLTCNNICLKRIAIHSR